MLGVALSTGMLAAFFTSEWRPGDYEQLLFFSSSGVSRCQLLEGVRDVGTSNTSCCLRRA